MTTKSIWFSMLQCLYAGLSEFLFFGDDETFDFKPQSQRTDPSHGVKVDSDIGLPMVNVLESTLESTQGEVIFNL